MDFSARFISQASILERYFSEKSILAKQINDIYKRLKKLPTYEPTGCRIGNKC